MHAPGAPDSSRMAAAAAILLLSGAPGACIDGRWICQRDDERERDAFVVTHVVALALVVAP